MSNSNRFWLAVFAFLLLTGMPLLIPSTSGSATANYPEKATVTIAGRGQIDSSIANASLRIMPLGDSITQGAYYETSYRYELWTKLIDAEIEFDFIGTRNCNAGGNPEWPEHKGRKFDRDHEGYYGGRVDQILRQIEKIEKEYGTRWPGAYNPDVVLLHLGSCDAIQYKSHLDTREDLKRLIGVLQEKNPNVAIFLAKVIPAKDPAVNLRFNRINFHIDKIAAEMSTTTSKVVVVDHNRDFDVENETLDGLHPNEVGDEKMAARWFAAIQSHLDDKMKVQQIDA